MNNAVLDKVNNKLGTILAADSSEIVNGLDLITLLQTCYKEEFLSVTKDISRILKGKTKQHKVALDQISNISVSAGKIKIDDKEVKLISLDRLKEIFKDHEYSNIKIAFCLVPENLVLLSLEKEMTDEIA